MSITASIPTECGFSVVERGLEAVLVEKSSGGASDIRATATTYEAAHCAGHRLEIRHAEAANGEVWVESIDVTSPTALLQRLSGSLRLSVLRAGALAYCELRQAQRKGDRWANLFKASYAELDHGAGVSVARELRAAGAVGVEAIATTVVEHLRRRH